MKSTLFTTTFYGRDCDNPLDRLTSNFIAICGTWNYTYRRLRAGGQIDRMKLGTQIGLQPTVPEDTLVQFSAQINPIGSRRKI